jgi:hypothetical protein
MGKRAKEHRKKVLKRNANIKSAQKIYEKMYNEVMKKQLEALVQEHKQNTSGTTENPFQSEQGV